MSLHSQNANELKGQQKSVGDTYGDDITVGSREPLKYQVFRDLAMLSDPPNILLFYEELIKQFGYVVLFSSVFPMASLMSYISNNI